MEHLPEQGFNVSVSCSDADMIRSSTPDSVRIREYRRLQTPIWGRFVRYLMFKDAEKSPPDLLHIQSRRVWEDGRWLARHLQRPYIVTVHDHLHSQETFRVDPRWCRKVIAVSDSVKTDLLKRTSLREDQVTVIHTGVSIPSDEELPPLSLAEQVPVVGTAGPLEAVKGFPFFLGAAQQVLSSGRDVEFLIAGAGPQEFNLRRLARELGIAEKVTFVPNLSELSESLSAMDIFCLPSLQQGLGTIMLEPMAMAKPVIAASVGGVYSIIEDGVTGLLTPPSNSEALAGRILELINNPQRAAEIGRAGRARVQQEFNVDKMIRETVELYRELLGLENPLPSLAATTAP